MKPHPFDRLSFLAGTVYLVFAIAVLAQVDLLQARWGWVWPVALLLFGVALIPRRAEARPDGERLDERPADATPPPAPTDAGQADEEWEEGAVDDR